MIYLLLISAVLSYLLGSISTSIIVSKLFGAGDIRSKGSGNAGATNTLRVVGPKAAVLVVIGDALKAVIAILLTRIIGDKIFSVDDVSYALYLASVAVVLGHVFPLYFGFRGGKGIMTAIAAVLMLDWRIGLILIAVFAVSLLCSNYVSLSSCIGAVCYPVLVFIIHKADYVFFASAVVIALIAIIKHHTNIVRLINGTESRLINSKNKQEASSSDE